jgi:GTP pyrophosphokinase
LQAIARAPRLAQWLTLNLRNNRIGDVGVRDLAAAASVCRLRTLDLSQNDITEVGEAALAASGLKDRIAHLDLEGNEFPLAALDQRGRIFATEEHR